jgi:hypothetical protein
VELPSMAGLLPEQVIQAVNWESVLNCSPLLTHFLIRRRYI